MANRQDDVDLRFAQISAPIKHFSLAWLGWSGYSFSVGMWLSNYYLCKKYLSVISQWCGPDSVDGIATAYGLDGPGIETRWGEIFRTCPDRPWGPPSLLYNGYRVFPGGKVLPGRDADPSPPSSAEV